MCCCVRHSAREVRFALDVRRRALDGLLKLHNWDLGATKSSSVFATADE